FSGRSAQSQTWTWTPSNGRPLASTTTPANSSGSTFAGPFTPAPRVVGSWTFTPPSTATVLTSNTWPPGSATWSAATSPIETGPAAPFAGRRRRSVSVPPAGPLTRAHTPARQSPTMRAPATGRPRASRTRPFSAADATTVSGGTVNVFASAGITTL